MNREQRESVKYSVSYQWKKLLCTKLDNVLLHMKEKLTKLVIADMTQPGTPSLLQSRL